MIKFISSVILACTFSVSALAAQWPTQPVKIVIPYGAGGTTDILIRTMQPELSKILGQPVLVVNQPGGQSMIGAREVADATDNHTFLATADEFVTNSITTPDGRHHMSNFRTVTFLAHSPILLGTKKGGTITDIKSVLGQKGITYGNAGGNFAIGKLVLKIAHPNWTPVQYKSGPQMFGDVIAGTTSLSAASVLQSTSYIKNDQIQPLVVFNETRIASLPDTPTAKELGIPLVGKVWLGLVAAKSTTEEAANTLSKAAIKVLNDKDLMKPLIEKGLTIEPRDSKDFDKFIKVNLEEKTKMLSQVNK